MDKVISAIAGLIVLCALPFLIVAALLFMTLVGAMFGWSFASFFPESWAAITHQFKWTLTGWQTGALSGLFGTLFVSKFSGSVGKALKS